MTIWGLSSGAQFVSTLLVCPHAEGLFHRAVVQSCCDLGNMRKLTKPTDLWGGLTGEERGVKLAEAIGCKLNRPKPKMAAAPPQLQLPMKRSARGELQIKVTAEDLLEADEPVPLDKPLSYEEREEASAPASSGASRFPVTRTMSEQLAEKAAAEEAAAEKARMRRSASLNALAEIAPGLLPEFIPPEPTAPPMTAAEKAAAHKAQLDAMRLVPSKRLVRCTDIDAALDCYESAIDSYRHNALKPRSSIEALESGSFHRVPVMIGYTSEDGLGSVELEQIQFDEAKIRGEAQLTNLFEKEFGEDCAEEAIARYTEGNVEGMWESKPPPQGRKRIRCALDGFANDVWYSAATWHMANTLAKAEQAQPVYVYKFTQKVHRCTVPCLPKMAWHGCDTTFWNGEEPIRPEKCEKHQHPRPAATPLGRTMFEYLLRFATSGDPNGPGLPAWEAHTASRLASSSDRPPRHMELGQSIGMVELDQAHAARHKLFARAFFNKRLKAELSR